MTDDILTIQHRKSRKITYAGGKGANLSRLARAGFPVPPFFIVSTTVFRKILTTVNIKLTRLERLLTDSLKIQQQLMTASLKKHMPLPVKDAFHELLAHSYNAGVAVRSSATVEDRESLSFAGQFESCLNIKDDAGLVESMKNCWISLFDERVLNYMKNHEVSAKKLSMAVVVQVMIPSQVSGVVFTVNPLNGNRMEMLVEVNRRLGNELADGKKTPESYVVSKPDLSVYRKHSSGHGVSLLQNEHIIKLAKLCCRVERFFGIPQDIEWALYNDTLYVIQARPVTTLADKTVWTNYFFAERFPQPISPLGWSVIQEPVGKNAFREPLHFLGIHEFDGCEITRCFYHRAYTDLAVFKALHTILPTSFVSQDKRALFYDRELSVFDCCKNMMSRIVPVLSSLCTTTNWIIPFHLRNWRRFVLRFMSEIYQLNLIDLKEQSLTELMVVTSKSKKLTDELLQLHRWSITFAELLYNGIALTLKSGFPEEYDLIAAQLHGGLGGNKTVEMNNALWELTHKSAGDGKSIEAFLQSYGHRSNSLDIFVPTWVEDSSYIDRLIEMNKDLPDPSIREREKRVKRAVVKKNLFKGGKLSLSRSLLIRVLLPWSQELVLLRENQRFHWQHSLAVIRSVFLEIGCRFEKSCLIENRDDIFFLQEREVSDIIHKKLYQDEAGRLIASRKKTFNDSHTIHPPRMLVEDETVYKSPAAATGSVYSGIGVSSGSIKAKARVLNDLSDFSHIRKGEILVTATTDPGWTPLFSLISGLVTEVGGILSHGSIIAREYGIPAVTNVTDATRILKTGDVLFLDGNRGIVSIEHERDMS